MTLSAWADISFKAKGGMYFPMESKMDSSLEAGIGFEYSPFTIRKQDSILLSADFCYGILKAKGLDDFYYTTGSIGAGYEFTPIDRLSMGLIGSVGFWSVPESKENGFSSASGLLYGVEFNGYFNVSPSVSLGGFVNYKKFNYSPDPFLESLTAGVVVRYNFTRGIMGTSRIQTEYYTFDPVFPVFFSQYDDIPFGSVTFRNGEKNRITDVDISIFIEKFMATPHVAAHYDSVEIGEEFEADITAFLNESILNQIIPSPSGARIIVSYSSLGSRKEYTKAVELQTLGRNNMSWDEDERAAAFVSGKDAAANKFANIVRILLKDRIDFTGRNKNEQYAKAMFAALKAYGINYVIDPASAFTDNSGSSSIDFLQFPYQTILYHGGDCDDLTILNCSLLEALGIDTAFITVPGHIYMAFDSGYAASEANRVADGMYIIQDGKVWIPVEITLCQDSYALSKSTGFREWKKYPDDARLIPVKDAWKIYKPVSIPESDVDFEIPSIEKILRYF
ncbi:MAG: hypothetical protein KBS64_00660 [Treponema sp.]|nr:hypothetical protein [Candidatus Treponema equi]